MASFSLSPSVEVKETDLTLIVPAVSTSIGAFSGVFQWGPVNEATVIDNEKTLVSIFGEPNDETATDFLTAASYLAYSNNLRLTRVVGQAARNAHDGGTAPLIENTDDHEAKVDGLTGVKFAAKYPGALGNSLRVSFADSATFETWKYRDLFGSAITQNKVGSFNTTDAKVTFKGAVTSANLAVGAVVKGVGIAEGTHVKAITSATEIELDKTPTTEGTGTALTFTTYTGAPATSSYVASKGGKNDELHLVVVDELGKWSGQAGTILEKYQGLSKARNAKDYQGALNYYADVLNRTSKYVWFGGTHEESSFGKDATSTFGSLTEAYDKPLLNGKDDNGEGVTVGDRIKGYNVFQKAESIDVSLVIVAGLDSAADQATLSNYVIENIANYRKDCIALVSPSKNAVVGNKGNELQAVLNDRAALGSTSYAVMASSWKLMYDRYSDLNRWVPLSGDIAGLCANTDNVADPWFSPAGRSRGLIRNTVRLAYNPGSKAERDTLYQNAVNPVTSQIGEGVMLYGDKTLQTKPSAFDRINVRRLFIVLEKAIATMAKYVMFEFNDEFTRSQFVARVEPYLREVQGRRGVTDFRVQCDAVNNTPEVIDSNGFVADIYLKPSRSINYVTLNFVATPTGVNFEEIA